MADARSLLRQQRAARRIDHPHATYSNSGKLSCTICHEPIKSEAQWEGHTRGVGHRQRLLAHQKSKQPQPSNPASANGNATASSRSKGKDTLSDEALLAQIIGGGGGAGTGQKRKHGSAGSDVDMDDAAQTDKEDEEEATRKKRSRTETSPPTATTAATSSGKNDSLPPDNHNNNKDAGKGTPKITPPSLVRRISGTPSHGIELQIPSRPATPSVSGTSAGSTPNATSMGRSPLIPSREAQAGGLSAKQAQKAAFVTTATTTAGEAAATATTTVTATAAGEVDEDADWAAFEAEVVNTAAPKTSARPAAVVGYHPDNDAVISAAPLTAEQLAAKAAKEEQERRRPAADIELEDEREEATRALEDEFEEMEELEARVRRLKEKREALRRGSAPVGTTVAAAGVTPGAIGGAGEDGDDDDDDDDDEDDDDEDEDDWVGFRSRG